MPRRPGTSDRPEGVNAVLDASGRGEIPASIDLAEGPGRVVTLVAFDAGNLGIQVRTGGASGSGVQALHDVLALVEPGRLQVQISHINPLAVAAVALDLSRT
ncbi:zinc-binding dehydrogenase [Streptomyces sp. NBC_01515]|uniref:zinc-binding dehydrogenase n=1 Tax=Streptomyces sp. NBC_01515 TaxID=2903890 RepID=UPI00386B6550